MPSPSGPQSRPHPQSIAKNGLINPDINFHQVCISPAGPGGVDARDPVTGKYHVYGSTYGTVFKLSVGFDTLAQAQQAAGDMSRLSGSGYVVQL